MTWLRALFVVLSIHLALAVAGCPARRGARLVLPQQPDAYDLWAQGLAQEDAFYAELQRLQRLYTAEPDLALAAPNNYDGQYLLSSRIEAQRAGLVLTERTTQERWTLWFFDQTGTGAQLAEAAQPPASASAKPVGASAEAASRYAPDSGPSAVAAQHKDVPPLEVMRDEATAGGYVIELSFNGGEVTISVTARWLQGRYLQCTRELTLGGLDQAQQAAASQTAWTLDGAWLPYRLVPGLSGPYGVVPDTQADGAWHSKLYPVEAMVPAAAAYDRTHGFMLAVTDDHPRKLDRRYELGCAIPQGLNAGAQIRCAYTSYDGTTDQFDQPWLASGLPIRDSIALEPFALQAKSADPTLVEAESAEVIEHIADFVHAFHFVPQPPALPEPGAIVRAEQLPELAAKLGQDSTLEAGLNQAAGPIGARLCLMDPRATAAEPGAQQLATSDAKVKPEPQLLSGMGIDDTGLSGGEELSLEQVQRIQQLKQSGLSVLAESSLRGIYYNHQPKPYNLPHLQPAWFVDESGKTLVDRLAALRARDRCGWPGTVQPNWRDPQALAWFTRKLTEDLARYPDLAGYAFKLPLPVFGSRSTPAMPLIGSYEAQNAVFQLHLGEAIRATRDDAWLLSDSMPNLGTPPWCGMLLLSETGEVIRQDYGTGVEAQWLGFPVATQRLAAFLLNRVFDVEPYLSPESESETNNPATTGLAPLVSRAVGTLHGMVLDSSIPAGIPVAQSAATGFPVFALQQAELANSCGELRVVHSVPEKNGYTGGMERPAECTQQVAVLPADWDGAHAVWVCFSGIGGTVRVDSYNYVSVSWEGGGWTGKLPTGYWEVAHPAKSAAIQPGDAALILFKPMAPLPSAGKPIS